MAELLQQGRITDEAVQELRSKIGLPLRPRTIYNTASCYDSVRHFCWGIGDDNPLWIDRDYGARTKLGRNLAPPSFLYSVTMTLVQMGLRGVHGFHAGTDWQWLAPIPHDERIDLHIWLDDVQEEPSNIGGRRVTTYYSTVFFDSRKHVLGHARSFTYRVERGATRERRKDHGFEPKTWTTDELKAIEAAYERETQRGAKPRYWEDVNVGDALDPILKGPLCMTDMMAFYAGAMIAPTPAHRIALKDYRRHPLWWFRNPENGGLEPMIRVHENIAAARSAGVPAPYDVGVQRQSWLMQLVTDWMGDDAFLVRNGSRLRGFNYFGDVTYFGGKIVRKFVEGEQSLVELEIWGENQRGERTIPGTALVELPSKARGLTPVERRLREPVQLDAFLASLPIRPKLAA
jgi:acyl dehydratase